MDIHWTTLLSALAFVGGHPSLRDGLRTLAYWAQRTSNLRRRAGLVVSLAVAALFLLSVCLTPADAQMRPSAGGRSGGRTGARQVGTASAPGADATQGNLPAFEGIVKVLNKKQLLLQLPGEQRLAMRVTRKTKFLAGRKEVSATEIPLESAVTVEVKKELNGDLVAVNILKAQPPAPSVPEQKQ